MIFKQARYYLEQTLKLRPNYPEAWNNLGMIAAQEGHAGGGDPEFSAVAAAETRLCDRTAEPGKCLSPAAVF